MAGRRAPRSGRRQPKATAGQPKAPRQTILFDHALYAEIKALAARREWSFSHMVVSLCRKGLAVLKQHPE